MCIYLSAVVVPVFRMWCYWWGRDLVWRAWPSMLVLWLLVCSRASKPLGSFVLLATFAITSYCCQKVNLRVVFFTLMLNFHAGQDELPQFLNTELLFPRANRSTEKHDLVVVAWYWLQAKLASLQTILHPNQLHQSEKSPKAPRLLIHIFHYIRQTIYYYLLLGSAEFLQRLVAKSGPEEASFSL